MAISDNVNTYVCKANNKIAELSTKATDMLEKTACRCDISEYVNDILDINTSLFVIDKSWLNISRTYGFKNYLTSLYSDNVRDTEVLSFIDRYIIRYDMNDASSLVYPLISYTISCCSEPIDTDNINNIVRVVYINMSALSGVGTLEEQVVEYINDNLTIAITSLNSKVNIVLINDI